MLKNQFKLNNY